MLFAGTQNDRPDIEVFTLFPSAVAAACKNQIFLDVIENVSKRVNLSAREHCSCTGC